MSTSKLNETGMTTFENVTKKLVSGGVAGCCAKSTAAPLDRIKILFQAHSKHYNHLGLLSAMRSIIEKERFVGLYKGNGVQMIRIFPYAAIQFVAFDTYKKSLSGNNNLVNLMSGSLAGLTAVLLTYPLDVLRVRLAFQVTGEHIYLGVVHAFNTIRQQEGGSVALYRGILPTMIGMVPYAGISFFSFEMLKNFCLDHCTHHYLVQPSSHNPDDRILSIPGKMMCGAVAGAFAQTISYPLDVVRRRIQLSKMLPDSHKYSTSWYRILLLVYREDGIYRGLYRGLTINYLRIIPMVSVSFTVNEMMKQTFGLDTGANR